jgi:dTDP-4-dehydrorhamnose reductase
LSHSGESWLVLGGEGRLGRALLAALASAGVPFIAPNRTQLDLSKPIAWDVVTARLPRISTIVNCAAYTDVDGAEREQELATRINGEAVAELGAFAENAGIRVIQISTNYVFDGGQARPYAPGEATTPLQHYGHTKLLAEQALVASAGRGGRTAIVRTGWLYGSHLSKLDLPDRLAQRLTAGQTLHLTNQLGSPTWSTDLAEYLLLLGGLPDDEFVGTHHATAAGAVSWYEFGLRLAADLGANLELVQPGESQGSGGGARRPDNALLQATSVSGYQIPDWSNGWERYLPEFLAKWRR